MKRTILLFTFLFSRQLCCGQCDDPIEKMLTGVWVKVTNPADTIKFGMTKGFDHRFELLLADLPRPQPGPAGFYDYRTLGTSMMIHWILSGNSYAQTIAFSIDKNKQILRLGNFYRPKTEGETFTFRKLK